MRVLFLIRDNTLADGIARHILNISSFFVRNPSYGVEVAVCIAGGEGDLSTALRQADVRVFVIGGANGHSIRILGRIVGVLREFKPDVIHAHVVAFWIQVMLSIFYRHIPVVTTRHGIVTEDLFPARKPSFRRRISDWLVRRFPLNVKREIFISQGVREFYHGSAESCVVYNPIDFSPPEVPAHKLQRLLGVDASTPVIGTVCRICEVKNPPAFVRIMCGVLKRMPEVHAMVCGSGEEVYLEKLQKIVVAAGVEKRFHWLGYRSDAPELLQDLSCFIMTSVTEGLPTTLLEAISRKVPVAFMETSGGLIDLARLHRTAGPLGIVVAAGDESGMVEELVQNLAHPEALRARSEHAFQATREIFALETVCSRLQKIYQGAVSGKIVPLIEHE